MQSSMEGQLEFRAGKGVMGKWETFQFRLTGDVLSQISLEDNDEVQSFELSLASDLALDAPKRECSLQVGPKKIRLRAQDEDDIRRWHEALADASERQSNAARLDRSKSSKPAEREAKSQVTQMLLAIYKRLDKEDLRTIDFFRRLNTSGDGYLSSAEFRQGLEQLGHNIDPQDFQQLIRVLDKDRDGSVGIKELDRMLKKAARGEEVMVPGLAEPEPSEAPMKKQNTQAMTRVKTAAREVLDVPDSQLSEATKALRSIHKQLDDDNIRTIDYFRRLDTSGDGYLSKQEFRHGLEQLGYQGSNADFKQILKVLDKDGDGTVGIKELNIILKKAARNEEVMQPMAEEEDAPRMEPVSTESSVARSATSRRSVVKSVGGQKYTVTPRAEMSNASKVLLAVFYKLDQNKMRTLDFFRTVDTSGDGLLSRGEFRKGLTKLGYRCSDEEFDEVMRVLDKDGDGTVSNKELDRALQKVARGEDMLGPKEEEEQGVQAMLQVDTVMNVQMRDDEAQTSYMAKARWQSQSKGPKTDSRPSRPSGATTEDCPIRQQLKLVATRPENIAILTIVRKCQDDPEEVIGSASIDVNNEKHHEVHVLPIFTEDGQSTGASVRLRVRLKAKKEAKVQIADRASVRKDKASADDGGEKVDRFQLMYAVHAEKQQKLENKRVEDAEKERRKLQDEANALKSAHLVNAQLNPQEAAERLYRDHAETERRRRARQYQKAEEERRLKAEVRQNRKMNRSFSDATLQTSKEAASRLYEHAVNKREAFQRKKEEQDAAEIKELKDMANKPCKKRTPAGDSEAATTTNLQRVEELYAEAEHRRQRKAALQQKNLESEKAKLAVNTIGKDAKTVNYKRLEELWKEHTDKQQKIATQKSNLHEQEQQKINLEIETRRKKIKQGLREVSQNGNQPPCWQRLYALSQNDPKNAAKDPPTPKAKAPGSTNVDYMLDTMIMALQLRCALVRPPDKKLLAPSMKGLLNEFKDAFNNCNKGEGCANLASRASQRLFPDGHLLPDFVGWQCVCEPSPIRQVESDLDALMLTAVRAQELLEQMIAPGPLAWRPGDLRSKPAAVPMALFAYSSGPKSQEAAQTKSMVRYGPAEGPRRYRHLLDLARISLVFASCDLLQAGLDIILGHMEVVDVRNNFRTPARSGNRIVEVLVILEVDKGDGNMMPFVCEIRLEEHNFWQARQKAEPYMQDLCEKVAAHYSAVGRNPEAVGYLSRWLLDTPCESHNLRVFKRHLLRHFGSTIGAWRRVFGSSRLMTFLKFRELCAELKCREHATEYWQELDIGRGGCISLFELDPESMSLLAKFRSRMLALADVSSAEDVDPETLWARLVFTVRPAREGRLEISEFKLAAKPLGFSTEESMRIFNSLDAAGGHHHSPPAYISKSDLAWLRKLPSYGDLDCIFLSNGLAMNESDGLRFVTWSGARSPNTKDSMRWDQSWSVNGRNGQMMEPGLASATLLPPGRPIPGSNDSPVSLNQMGAMAGGQPDLGEGAEFFADDMHLTDDDDEHVVEPSGLDESAIEQLRAKAQQQSFVQQQPADPAPAFNPPARTEQESRKPTLNLQIAPEVQEFTPEDEEDDDEEQEDDDEEEEEDGEDGETQLPPDLEEETF
eukprot:TRINITY_DN12591_c1_g5_i1.p1 TRINITY_DN12591_c1_g5~~TRINITY_DN12591_c1_g5_i1.p1  ORF type:complete len:1613 (+),score=403.60 TRINITY_DN12591_c1_g5_i1:103-4941(+)